MTVFTEWYGALRSAASGDRRRAEAAYRAAAVRLDGSGMPGLERGLLPLALLCLRLAQRAPSASAAASASAGVDAVEPEVDLTEDWGPYRPWVEPLALLSSGRRAEARAALRALPEPPRDLLYEAVCCLEARAAAALGDRAALSRAHARLAPAAGELAGAGSGLLTLGPVDLWLAHPQAAHR